MIHRATVVVFIVETALSEEQLVAGARIVYDGAELHMLVPPDAELTYIIDDTED